MAARATLRVGLVIRDIFVAGHAGGAVSAHLGFMNVVACGALRVAHTPRRVRDPVKTGQLRGFVTAAALGFRRHRAAMRLVTSRAVAMPLRTHRELLFVTGPAGDQSSGLVGRPFVACFTTRMSQIPAS